MNKNTITPTELAENLASDIDKTVKAVQIEKMRAIQGEDTFSDESTEKPISMDTIRLIASYKQVPKQNPFLK